MGQIASRLITNITINMGIMATSIDAFINPNGAYAHFIHLSKVLQSLASRARHGAFKKLELVWGACDFELVVSGEERAYDALLNSLRQGSEACRYGRVIKLPDSDTLELFSLEADHAARDMHFAFGGKLFSGNKLAWENYQEVEYLPRAEK